ncbi:MucBP domain-containing protein [Levilactobacillus sp. N40-8-2]|uniref:MucBP domain-containing protein n=1 Tax=Levilactobacillus muriae TaxID=3238987 RepID=UPI0038B3D392
MIKQAHVPRKTRTAIGTKKRCQCLVLLGISLSAMALVQAKPDNVYAAISGEQAEPVVSRVSQDSKASPLEPVEKSGSSNLANEHALKDEQQSSEQTPPAGSNESNQKFAAGSMEVNQASQKDRSTSKTDLIKPNEVRSRVTSNEITARDSIADKGDADSTQLNDGTSNLNKSTYRTTQATSVTQPATMAAAPKKAAMGKVYVQYVTDIGGKLLKKVMTGHVGDKFTAESLDFTSGDDKDYMLKGASQISGIYSAQAQTVTFVYRVPHVRYSSKNGMGINTVTYGDGSLKDVQIYDGDFEIDFAKNAQGEPVASVRSLNTVPAGKSRLLSSKGIRDHGEYFGLFNAERYSYILERSDGGNTVKILKINIETGQVSVQNKSLKASQLGAATIAQEFGIDQRADFINFWHKLMASSRQNNALYSQKTGNAVASKTRAAKKFETDGNSVTSQSLPQTGEKKTNDAVLGYVGLLFSSIIGLVIKREKRL